jgi:SAM-dependent methyltransferase
VWERPGFEGLPYSDGEARETQLLAVLKASRDVSTASAELRTHITDWASEYHFSPARHNLLRAFSFGERDRVLELGCGCGAITRFLGESGAAVLAVEGSRRRAEIAAERCRDLANVRVACDNLASFETAERFDVVTLIGVLEYSRRFIEAADPVLEALQRARAWLADGGVLILAIENRLGLKYFAGCAEDHLDRPYSGIEDLYGPHTAVTFGKNELANLLSKAGFRVQDWYYPFPDYKVPSIVVAEGAMADPGFDVPALLFRARSRDYRGNRLRLFDESLARREA